MDKKFAKIKQRLLNDRQSLTNRIEGINKGLKQSMQESIGELSMYDNHPADMGDELFERGKDLSLKDNASIQLEKVERALKKIDEHSYGFCDRCGREISQERLQAVPSATLCIECKRDEEVPDRTPRPIEEQVIRVPFGEHGSNAYDRKFGDGNNDPEFDGEDAWQAVARFGTSDTPQDIAESGVRYPDINLGGDEDVGFVEDVDAIPYQRDEEGTLSKDYRAGLSRDND